MTTEKTDTAEEKSELTVENAAPVQDMRPPLITKVLKSKVWCKPRKSSLYSCDVCDSTFTINQHLRYHIRRIHFNLCARTQFYEVKKINQTWFEKVRNSDELVEIKMTGPSTLVMKKMNSDANVVVDEPSDTLDLSHMYPTINKRKLIECEVCRISFSKKKYKKHYERCHS